MIVPAAGAMIVSLSNSSFFCFVLLIGRVEHLAGHVELIDAPSDR